MDLEALRALIDADPELAAAENTPDNASAIAAKLNALTETRVASRFVTARTVLAELGPAGADILDKLEALSSTVSPVKWAMRFVAGEGVGIDVGHPVTIGLFDALAEAHAITHVDAAALKSLAVVPSSRAMNALGEPVTWGQVLDARNL